MELDEVTAEIRPRAEWEAVDLGLALTREHLPQLLKIWCLTVLPLCAVIVALSGWFFTVWYSVVLIWWLKPLFERVVLFYLSRALFGQRPGTMEVVKHFPSQMKECAGLIAMGVMLHVFGGLSLLDDEDEGLLMLYGLVFLALLFVRSRAGRSFLMPVQVLEGLRGTAFRSRAQVLLRRGSAAVWLTVLCNLLEAFVNVSFWYFLFSMTPVHSRAGVEELLLAMIYGESWIVWTGVVLYFCSMSFVCFFYVGGGFGLYLNARTWIEGWDVELGFKRLGQRLSSGLGKTGLLVVALFYFGGGSPVEAAEPKGNRVIDRVMEHEDFDEDVRTVRDWESDSRSGSGAGGASPAMQGLGKMLFWTVAFLAVAGLIWLIYNNRHIFTRRGVGVKKEKEAEVKTVAGLEVAPESLPDDVLAEARKAWAAGEAQLAMSLLYRGAISRLVEAGVMRPDESATENDCLRMVKKEAAEGVSGYFSSLTRVWMGLAYGRRLPGDEEVEGLWSGWAQWLGSSVLERRSL